MVELTPEERAIAAGARGDGAAIAMRILAEAAKLLGAPRLIPIRSAHIDGALYHGDSGTLFAEKLVEGGARVAVRATLNVGALDLMGCSQVRLEGHSRDMAKRLMRAYEKMGCAATWTCAPYNVGHRPAAGTDVAWGESNAVAFCNSVLGARTNRYGDFLDIACAISGRAPDYGLHRPENRRATFVMDVSGLSASLRRSDIFYPILGSLYGACAGGEVGVIEGLSEERMAMGTQLKAFGGAAASTGAVALFHVAGRTPEAPNLAAICDDPQRPVFHVTPDVIRQALARLSTTTERQIDAVAIGSPHLNHEEVSRFETCVAGRKLRLPFYACTAREVLRKMEMWGSRARLEKLGVTFVVDTCIVVTPILPASGGVLMTNSGKFAHYAPGNTGYAVQYGSLADCVESAVAGRLVRIDPIWN